MRRSRRRRGRRRRGGRRGDTNITGAAMIKITITSNWKIEKDNGLRTVRIVTMLMGHGKRAGRIATDGEMDT
jgi:hypothetical protein